MPFCIWLGLNCKRPALSNCGRGRLKSGWTCAAFFIAVWILFFTIFSLATELVGALAQRTVFTGMAYAWWQFARACT